MSADRRSRRFGKLAALALVAALAGAALPLNSARAQIYLGWDFGHGIGVGIGTPPSAYEACPTYGFGPFYPFRCRYYPPRYYPPRVRYVHPRRVRHVYRHVHRHRIRRVHAHRMARGEWVAPR